MRGTVLVALEIPLHYMSPMRRWNYRGGDGLKGLHDRTRLKGVVLVDLCTDVFFSNRSKGERTSVDDLQHSCESA